MKKSFLDPVIINKWNDYIDNLPNTLFPGNPSNGDIIKHNNEHYIYIEQYKNWVKMKAG